MEFKCLKSNPNIYIWMNDRVRVIIPIFVDNLTLVSNSKQDLDRVKSKLAEIFKLKDLGPTMSLLGIEVEYNQLQRMLKLSQKQYIQEILS